MKDQVNKLGEEFDCGICYEIMHQAVTLMPCLHNFCGGCFSDWTQRMKECPSCREPVKEVKKNNSFNSIIERYLILNPDLKRDPAIIEDLNKKNKFTCDIFKLEASQDQKMQIDQ